MFLRGDALMVERGTFLEALVPDLRRRGARIEAGSAASKLNAVEQAGGGWRGAADPRSEGRAGGE
jgi:gamma-glutamyltranspeptidase/glutathione hydrolase